MIDWSPDHTFVDDDGEPDDMCNHCRCAPPTSRRNLGELMLTHCPPGNGRYADKQAREHFNREIGWDEIGRTIDFIDGEWVEGELSIQAARVAYGLPPKR